MVGATLDDVEAGNRAGCRTILFDNGNETEWHMDGKRWPSVVVGDLERWLHGGPRGSLESSSILPDCTTFRCHLN